MIYFAQLGKALCLLGCLTVAGCHTQPTDPAFSDVIPYNVWVTVEANPAKRLRDKTFWVRRDDLLVPVEAGERVLARGDRPGDPATREIVCVWVGKTGPSYWRQGTIPRWLLRYEPSQSAEHDLVVPDLAKRAKDGGK